MKVDLNCDVGEAFGEYSFGHDTELMDYVSSVNIACGFHAGDPETMRKTVEQALIKNLAIGAHPGFNDLVGFGRREIEMPSQEVYNAVLYQIGALAAFVQAAGGKLCHVKPHGAMYNMAARRVDVANSVAQAVYNFDAQLILVGLAGSQLIDAGQSLGLTTAAEAFADRTYQDDGSLTRRTQSDALIVDPQRAADQAVQLVLAGRVRSQQGTDVSIRADTICLHGDGPDPVGFARAIRERFMAAGIEVWRLHK